MKFFVDEQLPVSLAKWLRRRGADAFHIDELGLRASTDSEISRLAAMDGGVVITKDSDFVSLRGRAQPFQVVWVRTGTPRPQPC